MNRKRLLIIAAAVLALVLGAGAYLAASTWGDVNRVSIDRPQAAGERGQVDVPADPPQEDDGEDDGFGVPPSGDGLDVTLLVGSDSREELDDLEGYGEFAGQRADVVMVLIRPRRPGAKAALLSIPRDLWVDDVCGRSSARINEALEGCEWLNGPTALVTTVEDLIGIPVDHFAMVDLAGFQEAVDAIGGYEICVDLPVRDSRSNLALDAGCTQANGELTLAWLRSRHTQELTGSGWRVMAGVSDLTRNERQRAFLISMMGRVSDLSSPQDVLSIAQAVAPYVTVDNDLSIMDAVGLASTMKGLDSGDMVELVITVADHVAEDGSMVLVATTDISEIVADFLASGPVESRVGESG